MHRVVFALLLMATSFATSARQTTDVETLSSPTSYEDVSKAHIVVLRGNSFTAAIAPFIVWVGTKKFASLPTVRGYTILNLPEGTHTIRISCASNCVLPSVKVRANFLAGHDYYFVVSPAYKKFNGIEMDMVRLSQSIQQVSHQQMAELMQDAYQVESLR